MEYSENKYSNYIQESYGRNYYENEYGFITYQKYEDSVVINSLYVIPEQRQSGVGSHLADIAANWARSNGAKSLLCEIDTRSKTYEEAYGAITQYGFKVKDLLGAWMILEKEL